MKILRDDFKLQTSSQEYEKVPYIQEAIDHCEKEIDKVKSGSNSHRGNDEPLYSFEEQKR